MIIGLIPARGGSKRLPGKNIKLFGGRPLIAWTILEAFGSSWLDRIIVTTDSHEIADVARTYGAEVILRPAMLAADNSSVYDAIRHAIGFLSHDDGIVLLQPTSPLRLASDVDGTIDLAGESDNWIAVSSTEGTDAPNGAVYTAPADWLLGQNANWDLPGIPRYPMPKERSADINTLDEFLEAERMINK